MNSSLFTPFSSYGHRSSCGVVCFLTFVKVFYLHLFSQCYQLQLNQSSKTDSVLCADRWIIGVLGIIRRVKNSIEPTAHHYALLLL